MLSLILKWIFMQASLVGFVQFAQYANCRRLQKCVTWAKRVAVPQRL